MLSFVGLAALLFGIIEGPERGWTSGIVLGTFAVAAVFLVGFVRWERVAPHPMLPLSFFSDRRFSVGSAVVTTSFFVMFGFFFLFSLYLQFARGYSPLDAGLATLPFAVTIVLVSPRSATLAERIGQRPDDRLGLRARRASAWLVMSFIAVDTPYLVLVGAMVLLSAGMAVVAAPATGGIMSAVPLSKAGVGSAVNDTTRELGGALGIAVFGSLVNSAYRANVDLGGVELPPAAAAEAEESVGGAAATAAQRRRRDRSGDRRPGRHCVHRRLQPRLVRLGRRSPLPPRRSSPTRSHGPRSSAPSRRPSSTSSPPRARQNDVVDVAAPARDTDPRIERTRRVVLDAALSLLIERGYGELTIEAVAAESGVAKSTIYRHWPSRVELDQRRLPRAQADAARCRPRATCASASSRCSSTWRRPLPTHRGRLACPR